MKALEAFLNYMADKRGNTPLHLLAGKDLLMRRLLMCRDDFDVCLVNDEGVSAYDVAKEAIICMCVNFGKHFCSDFFSFSFFLLLLSFFFHFLFFSFFYFLFSSSRGYTYG